ncbi:MAG: DUF262 domain-containing protein [Kangiellaceae bacterium]|nr:DUF262 domain-containing protein [Kangiellaceae bacterium]
MAKKVNLDALIPREDFDVKDSISSSARNINTIGVRDLEYQKSFFFQALRKPDFQRETNEWDQSKIASLIESFLDGDLIPAVILWKSSGGYTFVIDGAHRLSALAAWINDDYGDGPISKEFYEGIIPTEQIETSDKARRIIRREIGLFSDYELAIKNPEKVKPEIVERAMNIGSLAIQVQWVEGDAQKAEASFFKINQKATPIDKTELKLLESRRKPNGIATRAILRSGKGHKYWSNFDPEYQEDVQALASEINDILFKPSFKTPIKTLDLPIGGKNFSSSGQMLILDFVNNVNDIDPKSDMEDDITGEYTVKILKKCLKVARLINSNHASSLGLHPSVYFYSKEGRYKQASFSIIVSFVLELRKRKAFDKFTEVRELFESALLKYDDLVRQINRKYRTSSAALKHVVFLYFMLIDKLQSTQNIDRAVEEIIQSTEFNYLTTRNDSEQQSLGLDFSKDQKSEVFIKEAIKNATKCKICRGLIHMNSISIDHKERKRDGGTAAIDNGQVTHPYCNTGYKN